MPNENPNKMFHWKNKLEDLQSLPGEIFNKEAAWGKLHTRLQPRAKNKKITWYWIAAAFLFFTLCISFFFSNKKENVLVKNNVRQKKINSSSPLLVNKDTSVIITSSINENKTQAHSINKIGKINTAINHKTISDEISQNKKEENMTNEIKNNAVMPVDTAVYIAANLPEKKRLKVVHINELGIPVSEPSVIARNSESHSFQLKLLNQEVYTSSSVPANGTRFKIFTTGNIPSN